MQSCVAFLVLYIGFIAVVVEGSLLFPIIRELFFSSDPELIRVRNEEDAHGDLYTVLETAGLIEKHGYPSERHNIITEDGYNISFYRIPGSPKSPPKEGKPTVLMTHGVFCSSDTWVLFGPEFDLAFLLADEGYDVWLGNYRGNTYARSHVNLTILDREFWNFSFHETGIFDVPNMINYILEYSGQKKLFYIAHSVGTLEAYIMLSERPEYNDKIILAISFGPPAHWNKHPSGGLLHPFFAQMLPLIEYVMNRFNIYNYAPQSRLNAVVGHNFCNDNAPTQFLCIQFLVWNSGPFHEGFNFSNLPHIFSYFPAGLSAKTMFHGSQLTNRGQFAKYDYGKAKNMEIYGTEESPVYDIEKIKAPFAFFWGKTDDLTVGANAVEFAKLLPNVVTCEPVDAEFFNHIDFLWSPQAKDLLYRKVIKMMSMYLE